jgi:hypothetical protein
LSPRLTLFRVPTEYAWNWDMGCVLASEYGFWNTFSITEIGRVEATLLRLASEFPHTLALDGDRVLFSAVFRRYPMGETNSKDVNALKNLKDAAHGDTLGRLPLLIGDGFIVPDQLRT